MVVETKRERFIRIAESRTNKIINMLRLLGNCASHSNYEYNEDDVRMIFSVLDKEMKATKNKFMGLEPKEKQFSLKP